jgi:hypothetical protein
VSDQPDGPPVGWRDGHHRDLVLLERGSPFSLFPR